MAPVGCAVCGTVTELACNDCKSAAYCSATCQKKDRHLHGLLCQKFATLLEDNPRPADSDLARHRLAILFPNENDSPELVWVKTALKLGDYTCDLPRWFSCNPHTFLHARHDRKILGFWNYHHWSGLRYQNASIAKLLEGGKEIGLERDSYPDDLTGNLVIIGVDKDIENTQTTRYRDVTLDDLRVALSYFLNNTYLFPVPRPEAESEQYVIFDQPDFFKAVMISCRGNIEHGMDQYREVMLNRNHKYIDAHLTERARSRCSKTSGASERMGITLFLKKCPSKSQVPEGAPSEESKECAAFYLLLDVDTCRENEAGWGGIPKGECKPGQAPTYLVFRKDKEDITKQQVEALSSYCKDLLQPAMLSQLPDSTQAKEDLLDTHCCAEKFEVFFESFKQKKIAQGNVDWVDATSPPGTRKAGTQHVSERALKRLRTS